MKYGPIRSGGIDDKSAAIGREENTHDRIDRQKPDGRIRSGGNEGE
jgi:hypothetical protein